MTAATDSAALPCALIPGGHRPGGARRRDARAVVPGTPGANRPSSTYHADVTPLPGNVHAGPWVSFTFSHQHSTPR